MNPHKLIPFFEQQQLQILETIGGDVKEETPTDHKGRLDAFAGRLADRFRAAGLKTEIIPNQLRGNHLRVRFLRLDNVDQPETEPALILCHYDTVWPVGSLDTHPFRVDDQGWAHGPGIFDMQSSLALVELCAPGCSEPEPAPAAPGNGACCDIRRGSRQPDLARAD